MMLQLSALCEVEPVLVGAVVSIVPIRGAHVEGLLYRLGPDDLRSRDGYEGHPSSYERVSLLSVSARQEELESVALRGDAMDDMLKLLRRQSRLRPP